LRFLENHAKLKANRKLVTKAQGYGTLAFEVPFRLLFDRWRTGDALIHES
jgi:hypothetical protein